MTAVKQLCRIADQKAGVTDRSKFYLCQIRASVSSKEIDSIIESLCTMNVDAKTISNSMDFLLSCRRYHALLRIYMAWKYKGNPPTLEMLRALYISLAAEAKRTFDWHAIEDDHDLPDCGSLKSKLCTDLSLTSYIPQKTLYAHEKRENWLDCEMDRYWIPLNDDIYYEKLKIGMLTGRRDTFYQIYTRLKSLGFQNYPKSTKLLYEWSFHPSISNI